MKWVHCHQNEGLQRGGSSGSSVGGRRRRWRNGKQFPELMPSHYLWTSTLHARGGVEWSEAAVERRDKIYWNFVANREIRRREREVSFHFFVFFSDCHSKLVVVSLSLGCIGDFPNVLLLEILVALCAAQTASTMNLCCCLHNECRDQVTRERCCCRCTCVYVSECGWFL